MAQDATNKKKITVLITCIILAAVAVYWFQCRSRPSGEVVVVAGATLLKCTNPECGEITSISQKEFQKMMQQLPYDTVMMGSVTAVPFECPHCGQKKAYIARKCPKCEYVYISKPNARPADADQCPKCGFVETKQ